MRSTPVLGAFLLLSLAFVAEPQYINLKNLGCWRDSFHKLIPSMEGKSSYLRDFYKSRTDAIQKCARAVLKRGYRMFGIQDGGMCVSSARAPERYSRLRKAGNCVGGKGRFRSNQIYLIIGTVPKKTVGSLPSRSYVQPGFVSQHGRHQGIIEPGTQDEAHDYVLSDIGCWPLPNSGFTSMEGLLDELDGSYRYRREAATKCARGLADLGYEVMALHDGGKCLAIESVKAIQPENPIQRTKRCSYSGKGTQSSIQVYEIRYSRTRYPPPALSTSSTTTTTAIPTTTTPVVTSPTLPWSVRPEVYEITPSWTWTTIRTSRKTVPLIWETRRPTRGPSATTTRIIFPGIWNTRRTPRPRPATTTRRTTTLPPTTTTTSIYEYRDYFHLTNLGCWKYAWNDTLTSLEGLSHHLDGHYSQRTDAVRKCAKVAFGFGYDVFAIQDGGRCASSANARTNYSNVGTSTFCRQDGKGGSWVNQVYEVNVVWDVKIGGLGCYGAGSDNIISSLEGTSELLDSQFFRRVDPIRKCARLAAIRGFEVFALHDSGECLGDSTARETYSVNGASSACPRQGKGGFEANEVYEIISTTKIKFRSLGCWQDSRSRAVPGMEQTDGDLMDNYRTRKDAISKCARVAHRNGFSVFVIQDGGWCGGSTSAKTTYAKYGSSTACKSDGEGGFAANQVFEILEN